MRPDCGPKGRLGAGIRRQCTNSLAHIVVNGLDARIQNGHDDLILGAEMVIDAARLDPCGLGDFSERHGPIALFPKEPGSDIQNAFTPDRAARCLADLSGCRIRHAIPFGTIHN